MILNRTKPTFIFIRGLWIAALAFTATHSSISLAESQTPPSGDAAPAPVASTAPAEAKAEPSAAESGKEAKKPEAKAKKETAPKNPKVVLATSKGDLTLELFEDKAPITVKNFLEYVKSKHYNGTIFHRVIPDFMIQGGGYDKDMTEKPTKAPIKNESANGLKNDRGTVAMARTSDPDSASAQFFINVKDNGFLNKDQARDGVGYAVFGKVLKGLEVVDKIKDVPTQDAGMHQNVPVEPVIIKSAKILR